MAATLLARGPSDRSILRNIFGKVGVSSRVELARAVERADRGA